MLFYRLKKLIKNIIYKEEESCSFKILDEINSKKNYRIY